MSTNYLQTANFVFSCLEFALKMGPEPIFTDGVGTAKFLGCEENGGGQA